MLESLTDQPDYVSSHINDTQSLRRKQSLSDDDQCCAPVPSTHALSIFEILSQILHYVPEAGLAKLSRVNKVWYEAACQWLYRNTHSQKIMRLAPERFKTIVGRVVEVVLDNADTNGLDLKDYSVFPSLRVLCVVGSYKFRQADFVMSTILHAPALSSVDFSAHDFDEDENSTNNTTGSKWPVTYLFDHFECMPIKLHKLMLPRCGPGLSTRHKEYLLGCTELLGNLTTFSIGANQSFFERLTPLLGNKLGLLSLYGTSFDIKYLNRLDNPGLRHLSLLLLPEDTNKALSWLPLLELRLSILLTLYINIPLLNGYTYMPELLEKMPSLVDLRLWFNDHVFDIEFLNLIGRSCPRIEVLHLNKSHFDLTRLTQEMPHLHTMYTADGILESDDDHNIRATVGNMKRLLPSLTTFTISNLDSEDDYFYENLIKTLLLKPHQRMFQASIDGLPARQFSIDSVCRLWDERVSD